MCHSKSNFSVCYIFLKMCCLKFLLLLFSLIIISKAEKVHLKNIFVSFLQKSHEKSANKETKEAINNHSISVSQNKNFI